MDRQLLQIWADVLSLEPEEIQPDDHLFDLGGDSIKAIRIIGKAAECGLFFDISTLYANPTIGSLSKAIQQPETNGSHQQTVEKNESARHDLLQRIHRRCGELGIPQTRIVRAVKMREQQLEFIDGTAAGDVGSLPTFIYQVNGEDAAEKLQQAILLVTRKHPILRTTFVDLEDGHYQVLLTDASAKLLVASGRIREYAQKASMRKLSPGDETAHYALVDDDGERFFVFSILHCFFDSYSRALIEQDLVAALQDPDAFAQQGERAWFGDMVERLNETLDDAATEAFWKGYLAGAKMDTIHSGGAGPMMLYDKTLRETVPASVLQGRHIQLATAITTVWALALMRRSGSTDVAFTVLALGRLYPYEGIDRLVGLLVKGRPFRLRAQDSAATIDSVLRGVQEDLVSAGEAEHGNCIFHPRTMPPLQSYVNIKLGGSQMEATSVGGLTLVPRRDVEYWESKESRAVYLEIKPLEGVNKAELRYHSSLMDGEDAAALLGDFMALLQRIGGSSGGTTVADILDGAVM